MLPKPFRRAHLRAFWMLLGIFGVGTLFVLSSFFPTLRLSGSAQLIGFLLLAVGIVWPELASLPYRIWNKLVPLICGRVQTCLLAIIYFVVFTAVGTTGSKLVLRRKDQRSGWRHCSENTGAVVETPERSPGWVLNYLKWAIKSGNWWTCMLLPFWLSLSTVEIGEEESPPTSMYTLY